MHVERLAPELALIFAIPILWFDGIGKFANLLVSEDRVEHGY